MTTDLFAFWLGGMVSMCLVMWAEWSDNPAILSLSISFRMRPVRTAIIVVFCVLAWPAFIIAVGTIQRAKDDD